MKRQRSRLVALIAACALFAVGALEEADHAGIDHEFVRISGSGLRPETVEVQSASALAWVNYGSRVARVSFDKSVAQKIACKSRASFTLDGERLVSPRIQGSSFASLCMLAPGTYDYRVELFAGDGTGGASVPERTLAGKLVVH